MTWEQAGRFRIVEEIGRGGMGVVYRAIQVTLDRTVALKILPPHLAGSGEYLARFRREAEVLARLQHENIVNIYDIEELDGRSAIVMEYVAGPSLTRVLADQGALPAETVAEIAAQLAAGLAAAHRKGIIHRDLKPDNILFTLEGRPKITDFGIARRVGEEGSQTRTGVAIGTPYYMSPEQARGIRVTGASDLYSLGVVVYQMLTGDVPFTGEDSIAVALKHIQEPPPPLIEQAPDTPAEMARLVHQLLEKEPEGRPPTAVAVAESFRALALGPAPTDSIRLVAVAAGRQCPSCATTLRDDFLTCPRCGLALAPAGDAAAGARDGADAEPVATPEREAPVGEPAAAPGPVAAAAAEPSTPVAPARLAWLLGPVRRIESLAARRAVWIGVVLAALGVTMALAEAAFLSRGADPPLLDDELTAEAPTVPVVDTRPGSTPTQPEPPQLLPGPDPAERSLPPQDQPRQEQRAPDRGRADPSSPVRDRAPSPPTPTPTPEPEPEEPPPFDAEAARRAVADIIERQRRATERLDLDLFIRDLHPELAAREREAFQALSRDWTSLRSEISRINIAVDSPELARADFHVVLTGARRSAPRRRTVLTDGRVFWTLARHDDRWVIAEAGGEDSGGGP